ncbi:MAG: hypothetical protein NVSMB57_07350 [Actinomycetota bacterium]
MLTACRPTPYPSRSMGSLERVEALAFSGRLREAESELGEPSSFAGLWWMAYLHNCFGRHDEALAIALEIAEESGDGHLASRALITGASALRQTGRHAAAFPLDEGALRLAPDDACRAHALIGLAADAVGLGRERQCAERTDEAASIAPTGDWRVRVRLAWVRCEHALLSDRPRKATTHARDALERARTSKARRHEAKSLLFCAFALREAGDESWKLSLRKAREIAIKIGATPIVAVADAHLPPRRGKQVGPTEPGPGD